VPFVTPGVQEVWKLLLEVRRSGEAWASDRYLAALSEVEGEEYVGAGDAFVRPTYEEIRAWEERYLPEDRHRIYTDE
jgi:hypothetical protein